MRRVHARMIAAAGIRQVAAVQRADAAAEAADAAVRRVWRSVLALLKMHAGKFTFAGTHADARDLLRRLRPAIAQATADALHKIATWGWHTAAANVVAHVPVRVLAHAATTRLRLRPLREAADAEPTIDWYDLLFPFRDPGSEVTDADWLSILFAPPDAADVNAVVYSSGWHNRLQDGSRLGEPDRMAGIVARGLTLGKSQQDIARELLPEVEGVRASARRVARTEGMRVAGAMQEASFRQLGDLVGYQVHATLDSVTRPWHAHRSGTIYYVHPAPGEKGPNQCPHPPEEAEDPSERPAKAPKVSPNCRCFLTAVLRDPGAETRGKLDALGPAPGPAHDVYDDWFKGAPAAQKRIAVGARRYATAKEALGYEPEWSHFVDPATGGLVPVDVLRDEDERERAARVSRVQLHMERARAATRATRNYGAVLGRG